MASSSLRLLVLALFGAACATRPVPVESASARPDPYEPLAMLVGQWEADSHVTFEGSDEPLLVDATVNARWDLGTHFVVARSESRFTKAETGEPAGVSSSVSWFGWDRFAETYVWWTFRDDGAVTSGSMTFDARARTWSMEERSTDPATGASTLTGRGTMQYLSDDEKIVRWRAMPIGGPPFSSAGRSRKLDD